MILLIGTIASGKSTYAQMMAKNGHLILNDDAIVSMLHGGLYNGYSKNLKPLYKSIENSIVSSVLTLGKTIIIDRGINITKNSRKRWIGIASAFDVPIDAVIFPFETPEIHAKRRFESDNRGLTYEEWLKATSRHIQEYEPPSYDEGFNRIMYSSGKSMILLWKFQKDMLDLMETL